MESPVSGAWHLHMTSLTSVTTVTSLTAAILGWCLYFRFLLLTVVLLWFIKAYLWPMYVMRHVQATSKLPLPPGAYGWPLVGETFDFLVDGRKYYRSRINKHGMVFTSHILAQPFVVVAGPELVRKVLYAGEDLIVGNPPPSLKYLIGEGAFYTSSGEVHKFRQRCMRRNFSEASLHGFVPEIQQIVHRHVTEWCKRGQIMGVIECKSLTFQVVSRVLMGLELNNAETDEMQEHFKVFIDNFFCFPVNCPGFAFQKTMAARARMIEIVKQHIKRTNSHNNFVDLVFNASPNRHPGVEDIPEEHAQSLFTEMLFGSNETTASTLCALLMRLTHNPQVAQRVRDETRRRLQVEPQASRVDAEDGGSTGGRLTYDDLKHLVYVNDVLKEVLRLDPPVAAGFRKVAKSFELGGYLIPEGWSIMYCITDTHEQSDLFPQADRLHFQPERWEKLREQSGIAERNEFSDDHDSDDYDGTSNIVSGSTDEKLGTAKPIDTCPERHHYVPFGSGPRRCIGQQFAKLFINILIVELCCNTDWEMLNPHPKIKTEPLPFPADGMPLVFSARQQE